MAQRKVSDLKNKGLPTHAKFMSATAGLGAIVETYSQNSLSTQEQEKFLAKLTRQMLFPQMNPEALAMTLEGPYGESIKLAIQLNVKEQNLQEKCNEIDAQTEYYEAELKEVERKLIRAKSINEENESLIESIEQDIENISKARNEFIESKKLTYKEFKNFKKLSDKRTQAFDLMKKEWLKFHEKLTNEVINTLKEEGISLDEAGENFIRSHETIETIRKRFIDLRIGEDKFNKIIKKDYDRSGNLDISWKTYALLKLTLGRAQSTHVEGV